MGILLTAGETPTGSLGWTIFLARKYAKMFWQGTLTTLYIAIIGTLIGFVLGYVVGLIQDARINAGDNLFKKALLRIVKALAAVYVEVFRDTPMIVQAMIIYFGLKTAGIALSPGIAGILCTVLNTGAYMAETVRAGIGSIEIGQREGAWAMGMSPFKTMLYVVLPQAFTVSMPPFMANGLPEYYSRDGEYLSHQSENDLRAECYRRSGAVYGSKNGRWQLLQVF